MGVEWASSNDGRLDFDAKLSQIVELIPALGEGAGFRLVGFAGERFSVIH
jgi:hypothetical protein